MTTFLVLALLLVYEVQVVLPVDRNGSSEQTTSSWLYQWSTVISAVAFVIMGCFLKRLTDVPTVEIKKNYTVVAGEKVKLKCCASAFPCIKSVSWKHILPEGETKQLDIDQQKYTSTKPNHIVINQTLKSDEGEYVCIVSNWFGKTQSKHTKLTVEGDLPTVKISERNYTAVLGEQVKLECTISATPWITTVSWQRISPEEQPVALDIDEIKYTGSKPNDPHLSINDIKKNDEGNYVCTVSNLCGKRQSAPTKLKVKGGPPMLNMKAKLLYKTEGELVLLKCTVNAEPPASDITWTKEGCERKIAIDNSKYFGGSLKTPSLFIDETESHDQGIYICEAENIAGPGSNFVHLTINSKTAKITGIETVNQDTPEALQEKIVTRHAEMVISLADYIYPTADDWQKFKVLLSAYLKPVDIGQDNLYHYVQKLIDMKNIDYGQYDKFYEVVNKTHPRISRIIVKAELDIEIMKNGRRPNETDYKVKVKSDGDFNSKLPEQCSAQITEQLPEVKHRINATGKSGSIVLKFTISEAKTPFELSALYLAVMLRDKLHNKQIVLKDESDVPLVLKTSPTVMIPTENQKDTPTIRLSRGHYRFTEGNVAILKCVVVATADTESIQWFRVKDGESHAIIIDNEKYFGGSLKSPSLAIADVKKSDRGIYFCRTRNRAGEVESEIAFVEINCIVKDASQLSQPSQTRRPSTVTNTIIKKQFAMASNVNDEVATLHNTMVFNIRTEMFGDQLEKVKCLFEDNPLTPLDMFEIKNIQTLFERLMNYETIDYGDYQKFVSAIRCIHPKVCSMVQECAVKINKLKGNLDDQGSSTAKQPKTEDQSQQQSTAGQEAMATNISNKQEVMARDIHDLKGDLAALNVRTANTSHGKKIYPDLEHMIETTKANIREGKEKKFYHTKGFRDAKDKLQKNRVVVIKGNTGDGKTAIAVQLLHWLSQEQGAGQPLQLPNIEKLDLLTPNLKLITFIDDIFGEKDVCKKDVQEWNRRVSNVKTLFLGEQTETNFLLITVRNEVFNSLEKRSMGTIFTKDNLIDLSSDTYKAEEEKKRLLELYKPENFSWTDKEKTQILTYAPNIGFPQCCQLFYNSEELQKERVRFFAKPFHFLNEALTRLQECSALLFLFLNDSMISVKDLDQNSQNVNQKLLEEAFEINLIDGESDSTKLTWRKKIGFVKESLEKLVGVLVVKEKHLSGEDVYRFNHDSIYVAVALLYGKVTPIGFIQNCPSKSLSYLTTSKTATNMIVIASNHYTEMCERLLREFECKKNQYGTSIGSLDVWNDPVFVKSFVGLLNDRRVDKLDVLNKASYWGAEECALYLLCEGVEPDEETVIGVVEGGSVKVLRKLLEYDVIPTARDKDNNNVLHEACVYEREEMVTLLCDTYPHLVHDTDMLGRTPLYDVALTGNCSMFQTMERCVLNSLYRVDDQQHKCESVNGRVVHRNCVCAQYMAQLVDDDGRTVLHVSCMLGKRELCLYLCRSYPALTTAVDKYGWHCLHYLARFTSDVDLFTECESHVKQYLESTGRKYDITTILDKKGRSVLEKAKETAKNLGTENNPLLDHLIKVFGK